MNSTGKERKPGFLQSFLNLFRSGSSPKPIETEPAEEPAEEPAVEPTVESTVEPIVQEPIREVAPPRYPKTHAPKDAERRRVSQENKGWTDEDVPDNDFKGKTIVITGILLLLGERDDVAGLLKSLGARVTGSVSSRTNIVITGDTPGPSKLEKVAQLQAEGSDIQLMSEMELISRLRDAGIDTVEFSQGKHL